MSEEQGRAVRYFGLHPGELAVAAAVAVLVLVVNKVLIEDTESHWPAVLGMGFLLGVGVVYALRWLLRFVRSLR